VIEEQTLAERNEQLLKAIEVAGGYVPRNPEVLQRMRELVFQPLPPTASHAEMAYLEGQRKLVAMICRQYQLATTGSLETTWQTIPKPKKPRKT
jgi:hypothetical protein